MQTRNWLWFAAGALVVWLVGSSSALNGPQAQAQRPATASPGGGELIALPLEGPDGRGQVTVIDPRMRAIAVYQVDKATGSLTLRSVRHVQWDLQMEEYNSGAPTPHEIRTLLQTR